jgi:hypothetical protein
MKKKGKQKLTLSKETVAILEDGKLSNVVGGESLHATCRTWTCPDTK